ncbi:MAG: flavodoxin family protein [Acetobacterium sp.]
MKILVIVGSLRKANTYNTLKKIELYHKQISECEYEYLFLKDSNLGLCKGCFTCIAKGEEQCPLRDDRDGIVRKIEAADGVILASPNYASNVSWLMKNYIDRFAYTCHRPRYFNQKFMILITSGSYMGVKNAMKALSIIVSGGNIISRLGVLNSPDMNDQKKKNQEVKIKKTTLKFAKLMNEKKQTSLRFSYLVWFSAFKAAAAINQKSLPADFEYYQDKEYFTECNLNIFQKSSIKIFTHFFRFMINNGFV